MKNENSFISRFLRDAIKPIADRQYQIRVWVKGEGSECDSFDETINDFYYYVEIINENYKKWGLKKKEFQLMHQLEEKIDSFCNEIPITNQGSEIIKDPRWVLITECASNFYKEMNKNIKSV